MKCKHCGESLRIEQEAFTIVHNDGFHSCAFNVNTFAEPKEDDE